MSSIGTISASHWNVSSLASVQGTRAVSGESADASTTQGTERHRPSADGGMMGDIAQVLQQMGIQMGGAGQAQGQGAGGPPPGDGPPPPPPDGGGSTEVGDAMHTLMHDLFQAVKEAQGTDTSSSSSSTASDGSSADAASSGGYDSFESGLQKVLQQISSGSDSALSERLSKDLAQLASALSAAQTGMTGAEATAASATATNTTTGDTTTATTDDSATTLSLEDFLSALQQRVAAHAQRHGSGDPFASQGSLFAADA